MKLALVRVSVGVCEDVFVEAGECVCFVLWCSDCCVFVLDRCLKVRGRVCE